MDWQRLAQAIIDRRVELGYRTREAFASDTGLSSRLLGDLERAQRDNFDPVTLTRLERALKWPAGAVREVLAGARIMDGILLYGAIPDNPEVLRQAVAAQRAWQDEELPEREVVPIGVKPAFTLDPHTERRVAVTDQALRLSWLTTSGILSPESAAELAVAVEAVMKLKIPNFGERPPAAPKSTGADQAAGNLASTG